MHPYPRCSRVKYLSVCTQGTVHYTIVQYYYSTSCTTVAPHRPSKLPHIAPPGRAGGSNYTPCRAVDAQVLLQRRQSAPSVCFSWPLYVSSASLVAFQPLHPLDSATTYTFTHAAALAGHCIFATRA